MAEGTSAPSYRLSQGTQSRVARAGLGGDARKHLQKAAMADEVGKIATDVTDQIAEKQEDTETRERAWDAGLEGMGDKGSWANPMAHYWRRGRLEICPHTSFLQNIGKSMDGGKLLKGNHLKPRRIGIY